MNLSRRRGRGGSAFAVAGAPGVPATKPINPAPIVETKPDTVTLRTASVSIVTPYQVWNGRLQNPDSVLKQFGTFFGLAFYRLMMQQNLGLSADCTQYEDRINAIDCSIKPGDPENETSIQMAKDCARIFKRIPNTNIINQWIIRCRWYGFTPIGKAGWRKDPETGLLAPFDLYNIDPWHFKFGPNGEEYLLTQKNRWLGEPLPARSVFYARWGSTFTPYGESDLRDVYLSCWYTQNVQEMLLQSIEVLGRPIPWIEVSDTLQGVEYDDFEAGIAKQYKYYVITRTPNARTNTTFPNLNVLANGAAGRSELEFIRYHAGLISRRILGTQQTQDKTGGSRALEDTRMEIAHDKTPPGVQLRDQVWTNGFLDDISIVNWPNQPRGLWPVMDSDSGDHGKDRLDGRSLIAMQTISEGLRLNQITPTWAVETLVIAGFDRSKASDMVASMTDPASGLSREPIAPAPPPAPPQDGNNMVGVATSTGEVVYVRKDVPLMTTRGELRRDQLVSGDEFVTLKGQ